MVGPPVWRCGRCVTGRQVAVASSSSLALLPSPQYISQLFLPRQSRAATLPAHPTPPPPRPAAPPPRLHPSLQGGNKL